MLYHSFMALLSLLMALLSLFLALEKVCHGEQISNSCIRKLEVSSNLSFLQDQIRAKQFENQRVYGHTSTLNTG
jgi:hypothetical protein